MGDMKGENVLIKYSLINLYKNLIKKYYFEEKEMKY